MIGSNFANELAAAGLLGLPFCWSPSGTITYGPGITSEQQTAIEAVLAAHDPTKPDPRIAYVTAINAGCQVVSTANPGTLNGTYAIDDSSLGKYDGILACINAGKGLPGGGETFNMLDISGSPHPFGASDFANLVAAGRTYVYDLIATEAALLGGHTATWPTMPVTIA